MTRSSCERKAWYTSRKHAEAIRRKREHQSGEPLRCYHCHNCGNWHLTHRPLDPTRGRGAEWLTS